MRSYVSFAALAAALCATASAKAQEIPDAGRRMAADGGLATPANIDQLKAEILKEVQAQEDLKLQKMREEMRDEIRSRDDDRPGAPAGEFKELPEEKPKLQFLELNGYFPVPPHAAAEHDARLERAGSAGLLSVSASVQRPGRQDR